MNKLKINPALVQQLLVQFIKEHTEKQGFSKAVLGLSGGLDSTVSAYLAVEALGRSNVLGVCLPHQQSSPASLSDANTVAQALQITTRQIDITPFVSSFLKTFPDMTPLQLGNVMARCRMISLYQIS
ncbi:NAD(+) synthase, partial [bacterium]|nr:NAD(+) synthase [bacterium]